MAVCYVALLRCVVLCPLSFFVLVSIPSLLREWLPVCARVGGRDGAHVLLSGTVASICYCDVREYARKSVNRSTTHRGTTQREAHARPRDGGPCKCKDQGQRG